MSTATAGTPAHVSTPKHNHKVPPNASKLIESLRHSGYDQVATCLDLGDNSIDARAQNLRFYFVGVEAEKKRPIVRIVVCDDGTGMDYATLDQAMRLGSDTEKDRISDLGCFGLGLWTASSSLGRRVTVLTKTVDGKLYKAVNDIDDMVLANDFISFLGEGTPNDVAVFNSAVKASSGTMVILDKLDRLQHKYVDAFAKIFAKEAGRVYRHFIQAASAGAHAGSGTTVYVNDERVQAIDPLHWAHPETEHYDEARLTIDYEEPDGTVVRDTIDVRIAVVPEDLGGEEKDKLNIKNQGIYVCRNNREIDAATTFGLFSKHNSLNRFRCELRFSGALDRQMTVNFSKTKIEPVQFLSDKIREYLGPQITTIQSRLQRATRVEASKELADIHEEVAKEIRQKAKLLITPRAPKEKRDRSGGGAVTTGGDTSNLSDEKSSRTRDAGNKQQDGFANLVRFESATMGEAGVIFEAGQKGKTVIITLNVDHPFYRRFFLDVAGEKKIVAASDMLLYAMAAAELKYSSNNEDAVEMLANIKTEMSSNLRTLLR